MSAKNQYEFHPDAEMLSAFAEQALGEHERGEVFAHLAVCGRCRSVVALASKAAGAESAPPRLASVRRRPWWRGWSVALAPVAALAATAVVAVYVHERDLERNAEMAKVEQQRADRNATPPQLSARPAAPVAAEPAPSAAAPDRPHAARHAPVAEPDETASAPPPEAENGPLPARDEPAPPSTEIHGAIGGPYAPAGGSAQAEVALYDEERRMQAEEKATDRRQFAAKAATPASESRSDSGAPGSSDKATVADEQLETQPAPTASGGSLMRFRAGGFSAARAANRVHLPSGLPATSIAHEGPRMLAIDNAGGLFLSEDSGANWESVTTQWTGRAVMVRKRAEPGSAAATPPADNPKVAGDITGPEAASESNTVFELLNDQGQLWLSTDGMIWTAK